MSLFVGNISKSASTSDLENEFKKFGPCNFRFKVRTTPKLPQTQTSFIYLVARSVSLNERHMAA